MSVKTTQIRGEDIRPGQTVILEDKNVYRVLRNDRARRGGSGALQLHRNGWMWRGYECHTTFDVVAKTK